MIEYASYDGSKERDQTPYEGKFLIYEQAVRGRYYAIFVVETGELEVHRLTGSKYRRLKPNKRGHYPIEPLGVELGVWHDFFWTETAPWLRWYDARGNMLPNAAERAEAERRTSRGRTPTSRGRTPTSRGRTPTSRDRTPTSRGRTPASRETRGKTPRLGNRSQWGLRLQECMAPS
jgi:Putative restriction endonuclease